MSVPMNEADFKRFTELANMCAAKGIGEVWIYTNTECNYVSLEIKASGLNPTEVKQIFGASQKPDPAPIPLDINPGGNPGSGGH